MENEPYHLFLTSTPYHIFLSCGLASLKSPHEKKLLIIYGNKKVMGIYRDAIISWEKNPFFKIIIIYREDKLIGWFEQIKYLKKICNQFELVFFQNLRKATDHTLYVFNDSSLEIQNLIYQNQKYGGKNVYIEDGIASYGTHHVPKYSILKRFLIRMLFDLHINQNLTVYGTYKYVTLILAFKPDYLRKELKEKQIDTIPQDIFLSIDENLFINILRFFHISPEEVRMDVLIIMPVLASIPQIDRNNRQNGFFNSMYNKLIENLAKKGKTIGIKYHPRERSIPKNMIWIQNEKIKIVNNFIPAELIFIYNRNNPKFWVIGDYSTALLSAKNINNDVKVFSTYKLLNFENMYTIRKDLFTLYNINTPDSIEQFFNIIQSYE